MISNLNGMFDKNKTKNQRQLVFCLEEKVEDCIQIERYEKKIEYERYVVRKGIYEWHLKNTKTIKITETKLWLTRSNSKLSYEKIVSQQEPILANAGKDCFDKYHGPCFKQGPCKWCGKKGMCCTQNATYDIDEYCDGTFGGKRSHECVLKPGNLLP